MDLDVVRHALGFQPNSDLFDVSIIATARSKALPLITKDQKIVESSVVDVPW
jgi:PIN domain nuclease of toxin-antitoxin system